MNKNILIVLAGAVLVAVLVAFLVQMTLGPREAPQVIEEAKVQVLVASKNLGIGNELNPGDLRWQEWPKSSVFPGAVIRQDNQKAEEALEGRLARNVGKGEPVMKSALLGTAAGNMVSASLEPGQRAVAIEVEASSMAGGFVGPGDFVDVILTYRETLENSSEDPDIKTFINMNLDNLATETLLQNVKVLAVDQMAERPEDNKVKVAKTVTLAVDTQSAEKLFLAAQLGRLNLSLRGVDDEVIFERKWPIISDMRLTQISDEIVEDVEKMRGKTGANKVLKIYSGEQVQIKSAP